MDVTEASARALRLERLAGDLELAQRSCPGMAESAGQMLQRVRNRLSPEVWSGPAAERAFAGLQAASVQAMWAAQETGQVEAIAYCAVAAAREVMENLQRAVAAAGPAGVVIDDSAAMWPAARRVPLRDPVPPPQTEVPPPPGAPTGFVGLHLVEAGYLASELANVLDWAQGLGMAFADNVLSRLSAGFYELSRDVPGTPPALVDLSWVRVMDRLQLIGAWGHDTSADLRRRIEVFGTADRAVAAMVTATFVFGSPQAATSAAKGDAAVIRSILKKDRSGRLFPGDTREQLGALRTLLECSQERFYDTGYAAGVLNDLGPKQITALLALAERAGPETAARLSSLIASATRSGRLDPKVEAALLADRSLDELANSDARLSEAFAAKAVDALLDPRRIGEQGIGIDGPDKDNLAAAQHLMARYQISSKVDPDRLAGIAANPFLDAEVVADMLRLATLAQTNLAEAERTLDGILAHLRDGTKESKRVLAEASVTHMDHLAELIRAGGKDAETTRAAINTLLGDSQARATLVDGAGRYAYAGYAEVASGLAAVMASIHPTPSALEALNKLKGTSVPLWKVGNMLDAIARWDGGRESDLTGFLAAGFGVAMASAGLVVTGGAGSIALAGVSAGAGAVFDSAAGQAQQAVQARATGHAQSVRDVAYYMVVSSLLVAPGEPPLRTFLVDQPPDREKRRELFDAQGNLLVPQPGSEAWKDFEAWVSENKNLSDAVWRLLGPTDEAPLR